MRRRNDNLVRVALWLSLTILALAFVLCYGMTRTEPVEESRPYYHIIGGMEDDVGHIIGRGEG